MKLALHLSTAPSSVVCREEEQNVVLEFCKGCRDKEQSVVFVNSELSVDLSINLQNSA